jgi:hypothetical protein
MIDLATPTESINNPYLAFYILVVLFEVFVKEMK